MTKERVGACAGTSGREREQASPLGVTPAKAGVQSSFALRALDTGLRRYDEDWRNR